MAGLGRDAYTLSCLGCEVQAVEAVPAVWALLQDLARQLSVENAPVCADGWVVLEKAYSDVVYLDPIYPARSKRALPGKEMQYLRDLAPESAHTVADWLELARQRARSRVVLKRRVSEPELIKPDWQLRGKQVRFDVYRGVA